MGKHEHCWHREAVSSRADGDAVVEERFAELNVWYFEEAGDGFVLTYCCGCTGWEHGEAVA